MQLIRAKMEDVLTVRAMQEEAFAELLDRYQDHDISPATESLEKADYFEYIMLSWGNCQAGDRLVMERKLGRFPNEQDLSIDFTPGVRFYFRYEDLANHPKRVFDGVLPMKIKDEIILKDWLYAMIVPLGMELDIPDELKDRTIYVQNDCVDIWDWSQKVYGMIVNRN